MTNGKKILIFAGTRDGREMAQTLAWQHFPVEVCVATAYGEELLKETPFLSVRTGRLQQEEMEQLLETNAYAAIIDATHPFAVSVSENIERAAQNRKVPFYRYSRETTQIEDKGIYYVKDSKEAAGVANELSGKIFLTTGSKELSIFTGIIKDKERIFARVIPSMESIKCCEEAGILHKQIIAMQGPFSEKLNTALMQQYGIAVLVTKETGTIGGFQEKVLAALHQNIQVIVIENPEKEKKYSKEEIYREMEAIFHREIAHNSAKELKIVGIGMGNPETMTQEARNVLQRADLIFGAERMLEAMHEYTVPKLPFYQKEKIKHYLQENSQYQNPVLVLSGDVGFFSGANAFSMEEDFSVKFYCGISSVSYFCSRIGINWDNMHLTSMHGRQQNLIGKINSYEKVFSLFSNRDELVTVIRKMQNYKMEQYTIYIGFKLSYPDEIVKKLTANKIEEILSLPEKGLFVAVFLKEDFQRKEILPLPKDDAFERGKVPMTKEEIRDLSIAKLQLYEHSVLWDIGSGTGSIAITCALSSDTVSVYAIEQKKEALSLLETNKNIFRADNMNIIEASAPEGLEKLPTPTHVFIGGSSGKLLEIMNYLWKKEAEMKIVINAVTIETLAEIVNVLKVIPHEQEEMIQVNVSKARKVSSYHLMEAQNAVYIVSFMINKK